jgi:hypothetical protein
LLRADPRRSPLDTLLVANSEELTEQQVLRIHGDIGLQESTPVPVGLLEREQVLTRALASRRGV